MTNFVEMSIAKAINAGIRKAMADNPKVLVFGEDVAQLGGVFRVTEGILDEFGPSRIFNSPIAESGIIGTAIGLAMRGYSPVAEIQFDGFIFPAFNQITSQLAKMQNRSEGFTTMPVVIRVPFGGGIGAVEHHSESPEAYFAHTAGLRVISPSNPNDAYWMIQQAIKSNDPVLFFEPKRRYWQKGQVNLDEPPAGMHTAKVLRPGSQVTVAAYGPMVAVALQAAEIAASEGTSLEVIDMRSMSPIDFATIIESVKKTGRLVVAHEASTFVSISSEVAARVAELAFYHLEAPVIRVGGFDVPYPSAKLEEKFLPDADRILEAVDRVLAY
ncbi:MULTISPECIES: alpha-ketoacid dehydrogenase subunit beta [Rhodoluna]|jgi:2-oxoisovalerate dehydrogenase E1 component beta subunit|uniref:alpha-ketoacid dehydrogenase subunit beta n=1 Tax=Rhodoluna TaxID=529883 RepID=UPI001105FB04|nr:MULTISPECIES: alpha-ketoacid dehydrogenase subunit beta [Rhodoluna]BDS49711.1 2-oxoisovalerate dehydrogenase subunit beta [Rhodoluna sp. KAS3]